MKKLRTGLRLLLALFLCLWLAGGALAEGDDAPQAEAATFFDLMTPVALTGETLTGAELAGERLTLVNLWATWCGPCVRELPELQTVSEEYAGQGVRVLGVAVDALDTATTQPDAEATEAALALIEHAGVAYANILPDALILYLMDYTGMSAFPTTWIVNGEGYLVDVLVGARDADGWRDVIEQALAALEQPAAE